MSDLGIMVLNLIITGIPSILKRTIMQRIQTVVLNLIITGIPSIPAAVVVSTPCSDSFKPYYNWNTFNTKRRLSVYW